MNTGENCTNTAKLGARDKSSLILVSLPYHTTRIMATWRQQVSAKQALRPMTAWPEQELGITPDNWQKRALALFMVRDEMTKISGQTPRYVTRGFCARPAPDSDRQIWNTHFLPQ